MLVLHHSDQLQSKKYKSIKEEEIQSSKQVLVKVSIPTSLLHMAPPCMLKHIETSQSFIKGSLSWN